MVRVLSIEIASSSSGFFGGFFFFFFFSTHLKVLRSESLRNLRAVACFWFVLNGQEAKIIAECDSPEEKTMAVAALKRKPALKTFHATLLVTRAEEWCVEAESAEEARDLLAAGQEFDAISGIASILTWYSRLTSRCISSVWLAIDGYAAGDCGRFLLRANSRRTASPAASRAASSVGNFTRSPSDQSRSPFRNRR